MAGREEIAVEVLGEDETYRALFDNMLNGLAYCRMLYEDDRAVDFVYLAVNQAFVSQTGLSDVIGRRASDVLPGLRETDDDLLQAYGRVAASGKPERFEHYLNVLQMWRSVSVYCPKPGHIVAIFDIITERKQAEARLNVALAEAERLRRALDHVPAYIYMKDLEHRYIYANKLTMELFGGTARDLIGKTDEDFFPASTVAKLHEVDNRVFAGALTGEEIEIPGADGHLRVYWEVKAPIFEQAGADRVWGLVGISTDITEHKELEARLEIQAHTDFLTGLPNRSYFFELAEKERARAVRYKAALSLVMIDLDHFKLINDTYGHEVGDRALREFAHVCRQTLRDPDLIGRIGGEEFAVLLPETSGWQAYEAADRLRLAIAAIRLPIERGLPVQFTASLGVASLTESDVNLDVFLNRADRALFEAKRNGRNRTCEIPEGK
ncbi:sensor domain-containing diguanylate cyclase [Paludibacterium yongneupense]|uniref:sensor domain-containing diguanylate cyclase n=1 Tax=Paludibacterium yongneupense TaxID=400061 RepID=UPI000403BF8A|nr:diguanylate cyclase [Paludibacterium yongneupense]